MGKHVPSSVGTAERRFCCHFRISRTPRSFPRSHRLSGGQTVMLGCQARILWMTFLDTRHCRSNLSFENLLTIDKRRSLCQTCDRRIVKAGQCISILWSCDLCVHHSALIQLLLTCCCIHKSHSLCLSSRLAWESRCYGPHLYHTLIGHARPRNTSGCRDRTSQIDISLMAEYRLWSGSMSRLSYIVTLLFCVLNLSTGLAINFAFLFQNRIYWSRS